MLTRGFRLGHYEIVALLGRGGMGEVYRAADTRLGRTIAIKVLPPELADDPERRERLEREARIAGSLNHPHICTLHDVGEHDGRHYLVMECIEGTTLARRIEAGALPLSQALDYAVQIADALDKAHRHGVVHRDLKPGNVMLTASGVKLLDFGLAVRRPTNRGAASDLLTREHGQRLTTDGTILGTLQYMAPEQLEGREADARTDIFAFGALVYEMITGAAAFEGRSNASVIGAILRDDPRPIREHVPDAPPALGATLSRCLAKDPDERWQSAGDLAFQLRSIRSAGDAPTGHGVSRGRTWRAGAIWPLAVMAALVVAGISPDGDLLLYVTDASGQDEVWVAAFPSATQRRQISVDGGGSPEWGRDGTELFYLSSHNDLMRAALVSGEPDRPEALFRVANLIELDEEVFVSANAYLLAPDGERFLVAVRAEDPSTPPIEIVLNWPALLRR